MAAETDIQGLEAELLYLRREIGSLRGDQANRMEIERRLTERLAELEQDRANWRAFYERAEADRLLKIKHIHNVESLLKAANQQIAELGKHSEGLATELHGVRCDVDALRRDQSNRVEVQSRLESQLAELERHVENVERQREEANGQIENLLKDQMNRIRVEARLQERIADIENDRSSWRKMYERAEADRLGKISHIQTIEGVLESRMQQLADLQTDQQNRIDEMHRLTNRLSEVDQYVHMLESDLKGAWNEVSTLRNDQEVRAGGSAPQAPGESKWAGSRGVWDAGAPGEAGLQQGVRPNSIEDNLAMWSEYDWSGEGHEWSETWGTTSLLWWSGVFPRIAAFLPADCVLEIGPGYGRLTQYLIPLARRLILVDLTPQCIEACRRKFGRYDHVRFYVNDGATLPHIPDRSVDFAFSYDSLVHADAAAVRSYLRELSRTLKPDGIGFIHHSNLGSYCDPITGVPRVPNPHWRAPSMSATLFVQSCLEVNLACIVQELVNWEGPDVTDCLSVLTPSGSRWERPLVTRRNSGFMLVEASRARQTWELYGRGSTGAQLETQRSAEMRNRERPSRLSRLVGFLQRRFRP